MYVKTDDTGRITATTQFEEYSEGMSEFDFPEDFDFDSQSEWRIVNGELLHDPLPQSDESRIAELRANLASTDYVPIKAMDAALLRGSFEISDDVREKLEQRKAWREEINAIEPSSGEVDV